MTRESQNIAISKIVELLFLIRKLSEKGLILFFHDNSQLSILAGRQMDILRTKEGFNINNGEEYIKSNWEWIDKNGSILYTPFILNGGEIPLHKYLSGGIFISQELRALIDNDFKSDEEIQFQKELRYTKISLWIALVGLIIATASIFGDFWKDLIQGLL